MSGRKARAPQPGPVCYGRGGTEPTITDANLVLGRLAADRFLGGEMRLDVEGAPERARSAASRRRSASISTAAADGILRIATTKMSHMVRWVTTERGLDAARIRLVAYGGAGPLHAAMVARELRIAQVDDPARARPFLRLRHAGRGPAPRFRQHLVHAVGRGVVCGHGELSTPRWRRAAASAVARSGIDVAGIAVQRAADMRYVGQEHAVTVELPVELFRTRGPRRHQEALRCVHETRYGYSAPAEKAEIVSLRSAVIGLMRKPAFEPIAAGEAVPPPAAFRGTRPVYFAEAGGFVDTPTYDRAALLGRQPHRRTGADRGVRFDHRRASRRRG